MSAIPDGARVGSLVTLDEIQARFCDGTDVRAKKKKEKRTRHLGNGRANRTQQKNTEIGPPPSRYFIVEGQLDSGFLNFRAFLFNDMLLLATPQDDDGPYFSAKSVPLWYHGLSTTSDAEVTTMPDETTFMIKSQDGRTIFRGAPKSWPPLPIWVALLRRCLNGCPPAPEHVLSEVRTLWSQHVSADDSLVKDGDRRLKGDDIMDERGQNKEDPSRDSQDEAVPREKLMAHENYRKPSQSIVSEHDSGRTSRRHSAITAEEVEVAVKQGSGRTSRKGSLELPSQVPSLLSDIMQGKSRSRALSPKTPQSWTSSDQEEADPDSAAGNLTGAQRSLQRLCRVLRHCSRRMLVTAPTHVQEVLGYGTRDAESLRFFRKTLAVSRMQTYLAADPGFRRALVHDCIDGDPQLSRMHLIDTAQPLAGNWLSYMPNLDDETRKNISLVAQYWSTRALLCVYTALKDDFASKSKSFRPVSSTLAGGSGESSQEFVLTQHELCKLLLGGHVSLVQSTQQESAGMLTFRNEDWPRSIPTKNHQMRPVVARCLLERVVGYDQYPKSCSVDMGLDEGSLDFQHISVSGFVQGNPSLGLEGPNMTLRHVSALAILLQCLTEAPTVDSLSVNVMLEIRDLFCKPEESKDIKAFGHSDRSKTEGAISNNLSLLVAESEGNWPLWFVSVVIRSAGSFVSALPRDQIFHSSSRFIGSLAAGSDSSVSLYELSCDILASVMAKALVEQVGSRGSSIPINDQFSFGRALNLVCDAIAFFFSDEDGGRPILTPKGEQCMRRFLTRLVSSVQQDVSTVLQIGTPGFDGSETGSAEKHMIWRTIPDFSQKHWAEFYEMLVFVESFVFLTCSNRKADEASTGSDFPFMATDLDAVPRGYFRSKMCNMQFQAAERTEQESCNLIFGIHLASDMKGNVCLDLPLVSSMISVLQSVYRVHRIFEEDSTKVRHLPEHSALNDFGQSLAMFESISDLMRSVEKSLKESYQSTAVKYQTDATNKYNILDNQIFAAALCCEPRLRNLSRKGSEEILSRGSGLGLIGAPTATEIARQLAIGIERVVRPAKHLGTSEIESAKSSRVSPVSFNDHDFPTLSQKSKLGSHKSIYRRRLTSILNMDADALQRALKFKMESRSATPHQQRLSTSTDEDNPINTISKREFLEAEVLRLKGQLKESLEMKHKILALNEEVKQVRQRTAKLGRRAVEDDEDYRADAAELAKDLYLLKHANERTETKPGASSFSSSTQRMEDHLLNELCLIPRCNREDNSQDWPQTLDNKVGDISIAAASSSALKGRRASLEAYYTDWQKRWDRREEEYVCRMEAAQKAHGDKLQAVLAEQANKETHADSPIESEAVLLLRNQVTAAYDALERMRIENANGSGEAVMQSAKKHAEDVQKLVHDRHEWERRSMQSHRSKLAELEVKREKVQSHALDNLSKLGEHFDVKAKAILDTQARIDRNPAFAWSPEWLSSKIEAHYDSRETEIFKQSGKINNENTRITIASWEDRFQQLTTFLKLRYDAYQEHLELNEADVDLLDEEDAEKLGPADGKKSAKNDGQSEDSGYVDDIHEFRDDDLNSVDAKTKDTARVKLFKKGISQKFWQLLRHEKNRWKETCSLGCNVRLQHKADVNKLLLQQCHRQLNDTIFEGKLCHARWRNVLRENGQRQLQALKLIIQEWHESSKGDEAMEEWHATQDKFLDQSSMGVTALARMTMDIQLSHQKTAEAWKAAATSWKQDVQLQTEKAMAVVSEAIEDAYLQAISYMLREVEEARMDLQSIRDQIMHGKIHALKEEMDHKALVASMERHQEQEKVRERAKRIELETLKAHVLTMWNRMGVSLEERAQWLLLAESEMKGDYDSHSADSSTNPQKKLIKLYEESIQEARTQHLRTAEQQEDGVAMAQANVSQEWRRRSLYGVDTVTFQTPIPNDQRQKVASNRDNEVGMAPSVEPMFLTKSKS